MDRGFLLITNAIRPYHRHNISILSLPPGGMYHFRYEKKYISASLSHNIAGVPGLLVVRDRKTGRFLPLRWCSAVREDNYGEFVFFDFRFEDIFDLTDQQREHAWDEFGPSIQKALPQGTKNEPEKDLAPLVFPVSAETLKELGHQWTLAPMADRVDSHIGKWVRIVSVLGSAEAYKNEHFYTISRLHSPGRGSKDCIPTSLKSGRVGYELQSGKLYFLEMIQATVPFGAGTGPFEDLSITAPAGHI